MWTVSVVIMPRAAAVRWSGEVPSFCDDGGESGGEFFTGEEAADDSGGADEDVGFVAADEGGDFGSHPLGVVESAPPGAGVGVAGVDDDSADGFAGHSLA